MVYSVVIGRNEKDHKDYGDLATTLIGKQYITMGNVVSLGNNIMLDALRPHVVLIAGKRGSGKSYTMGVIAEGLASLEEETANSITSLIIDTMGIYWTMKNPNYKEADLLKQWGYQPTAFKNINVFVPKGAFDRVKEENVEMADYPFSISANELSTSDWCDIFGFSINDEYGILINQALEALQEDNKAYDLKDIIENINSQLTTSDTVKEAVKERFESALRWGLFEKEGTKIEDLLVPGHINILDISLYAHSLGEFSLRALVIGLLSQKILEIRTNQRRVEELGEINSTEITEEEKKRTIPIVWMFIDEVHEFLPANSKTAATASLSRVIKEGRQPGIGLVIATQQPGKLDTDIITQSDIIISQHVTAKLDIDALNTVMQTYMGSDIRKYLMDLPRLPGACIILDDNSERIYPVQIRPRLTWHGGETPKSISKKAGNE
ncbi:MAG: ATP-binding protein [Candidatus Parvarchaeota archaeon]|nr:ATP-binding protein [Candidatus Parvarchaeota archaeon]MCW1294602.1 ATP-binding protein [Candidatus Parvarchaeum tengchongense]MCW1295706.1 ATP-binding protein [Candidatus Parvarchaeum tengchongense]MCW1298745.1 ATP-binding protein [Candidatus Parvarchaeum tengchongense]MCW1312047.1 ATP-binding protein [Candidatus Parvarchaeum tengchongense]